MKPRTPFYKRIANVETLTTQVCQKLNLHPEFNLFADMTQSVVIHRFCFGFWSHQPNLFEADSSLLAELFTGISQAVYSPVWESQSGSRR